MEHYLFEPEYADGECSSDSESSDIEGNEDMDRVGNTFWCSCGLCSIMSRKENVCCQEWDILQEIPMINSLVRWTKYIVSCFLW